MSCRMCGKDERYAKLVPMLRETLDALYNETHGQSDTPWISDVKERAKSVLEECAEEDRLDAI